MNQVVNVCVRVFGAAVLVVMEIDADLGIIKLKKILQGKISSNLQKTSYKLVRIQIRDPAYLDAFPKNDNLLGLL